MSKILPLLLIVLFVSTGISQDVRVVNVVPTGINSVANPDFGGDVLISAAPIGSISGIMKTSNNTVYVAANDTLATSNCGMVIWQSTNGGSSWTMFPQGINTRVKFEKIKLVRTGLDSVYAFYQIGLSVYCWNFLNGTFMQFDSTNIRQFDVVGSSTGSLYLITHHVPLHQLRRFSSTNGGMTWGGAGYIAANSGFPVVCMSANGDTLLINYRNPIIADTLTSVIRQGRYRETAPGTLSSSGFQDLSTEAVVKSEYKSVYGNGVVWFFYTTGTTGNIDIQCRVSTNSGTNFATSFTVAGSPTRDEYWMDTKFFFVSASGGADLIYYSDSLQSGTPTNNSDKLVWTYATYTNPNSFYPIVQVSNHPPEWSTAGYIPTAVELPGGVLGTSWVGYDGTVKKLYWDAANLVTSTGNQNTIVNTFKLEQNYPNPFNPVTNIKFSIPKNSSVKIVVYDAVGKEIEMLVNQNLNKGEYEVKWNGAKYSSGIYFYKLTAGEFSSVKKMVLVK